MWLVGVVSGCWGMTVGGGGVVSGCRGLLPLLTGLLGFMVVLCGVGVVGGVVSGCGEWGSS